MKDIACRVFRHMEKAQVAGADGSLREGRGAVTRWKGQAGDCLGAQAHGLGMLTEPLYVFTGSLPAVQPGDVLSQGGESYTVLQGSQVVLGDMVVCMRAVLEKRGAEDDSL